MVNSIRAQANCKPSQELFACLRTVPIQQLLKLDLDSAQPVLHPVPDGDFFTDDVSTTHSYASSQRLVKINNLKLNISLFNNQFLSINYACRSCVLTKEITPLDRNKKDTSS